MSMFLVFVFHQNVKLHFFFFLMQIDLTYLTCVFIYMKKKFHDTILQLKTWFRCNAVYIALVYIVSRQLITRSRYNTDKIAIEYGAHFLNLYYI